MKSVIILIVVLCFAQFSFGQEELQLTDFQNQTIPLSPEAASLGSYSYTPVNLANGMINVSVPIWTMSGNNLSLPINLSYKPGVKIEETSAYTGHGWSLLAGGVITRNVVDKVDPYPRLDLSDSWTYQEASSVESGNYDSAPDVFTYNFNGYTGQFALKNDLVTPYYIKDQRNWKIDYDIVSNNINSIIIYTEDGTKYIFGHIETTNIDNAEGSATINIPTAWYLSQIVSSKIDEKIVFTYYRENLSNPILSNNSLEINPYSKTTRLLPQLGEVTSSLSTVKLQEINFYHEGTATSKVTFEANTPRNDVVGNGHALSKISIYDNLQSSLPLKYFDFDIQNVNDERLFLKSIQEFSGNGSISMPPHEFEYINPSDLPGRLEYKADHWGYYSSNGTEFPYLNKFKWRTAKTKEPSLHAQYGSLSKRTFPTGAENYFNYGLNQYNQEDWDYTPIVLELNWRNNYNRWEKPNGTASNLLTHTFTTPVDQFMEIDFCLILEKENDLNGLADAQQQAQESEIAIIDTATGKEVFYVKFDAEGDPEEIDMLVSAEEYVTIDRGVVLQDPHPNDVESESLEYNSGFISKSEYVSTSYAYESYGKATEWMRNLGECLNRPIFITLPAGTYTAIVKTSSLNAGMENGSIAKLEIKPHFGNRVNKKVNGGGIRIQSQTLIDDDLEETTTIYTYEIHDKNGKSTRKSSGEISEKPLSYLYTPASSYLDYVREQISPSSGWSYCQEHPTGTSPSNPLFAKTGSFRIIHGGQSCYDYFLTEDRYTIQSKPYQISNSWITYSEVKERIGDEVDYKQGFTIYKFNKLKANSYYSTFIEYAISNSTSVSFLKQSDPSPSRGWPFNGILETSPLAGKPFSTLDYIEKDADNSILLKEEIYDYNTFRQDRLFTAQLQGMQGFFVIGTSHLERDYSLLKSKETILYDQQGNNPISNKVGYEYDDGLYMPNKIITTDSEGNKLIKKLKYSTEYANVDFGYGSSIGIQNLKDRNIITPIEEQLWENRGNNYYLIGGRLNIFDDINPANTSNELLQKSKVISYKAGNSAPYNSEYNDNYYGKLNWYELNSINDNLSVTNLSYYPSGNLKAVAREDGVPTTYIWGYNKMYPVAKIENATSSQIAGLPGFSDNFNTGSNGLTAVQENTLRNGLPNAMTTTYTYNPLIGITSMTDPRGYTITYYYDKLNRLEFVKDTDGNLVSENKYNYKN